MSCEKQEQELMNEMRCRKPRKGLLKILDNRLWLMMAMLLFISSSFVVHSEIPFIGFRDYFPATWICSNCGYDNYEGIDRCAVCGEKR